MLTERITPREFEVLKGFVDTFLAGDGAVPSPYVPQAMLAGEPDKEDWCDWKAVDSPVCDSDIIRIEQMLDCKLPALFCGYLTYKSLLMTDLGIVRLPETPCDAPLQDFLSYAKARDTLPNGLNLLPFGYYGNDVGCICFDISNKNHNDYPVVLFDHTRIFRDPSYRGDLIWENFEALLVDVTEQLKSDL